MGDVINFKGDNGTERSFAPISQTIVINLLEELRETMTETLGYAEHVGCDVERVRECIKIMADSIELEGNRGEHS